MKSTRLYNSAAFRLTMLYILIFGASVTVLLVFIYTTFSKELDRQTKYDINIQRADLGRKFIRGGRSEAISTINHLIAQDTRGNLVLMLIDRNWNVLAGNLPRWPGGSTKEVEWVTVSIAPAEGGTPMKAIAINSALPGGHILLVGRTLESQEKIRKVVSDVLLICFGLTAFLAAAGGIFMSRMIRRRLETVNIVCETVMEGKLDARVVVSGSDDEFDHLSNNINRMLIRIEELIGGVRDISYNVAHDLRTPLNRLRNRVEGVLHQDMSYEAAEEQLRACLQEIDDLVATFNAILRISQAEAGAGIEHFALCAMNDLLGAIAELYRPVSEDKSIEIRTEFSAPCMVLGDRHLLSQAFANLMDNAIKYTQAGGTITISTQIQDKDVCVEISDNGPGIPEDALDKVTKKFFRLESSRSTPGNGLGLSLVEAAVKLHGGSLTLQNNHPGLAVKLRFPTA